MFFLLFFLQSFYFLVLSFYFFHHILHISLLKFVPVVNDRQWLYFTCYFFQLLLICCFFWVVAFKVEKWMLFLLDFTPVFFLRIDFLSIFFPKPFSRFAVFFFIRSFDELWVINNLINMIFDIFYFLPFIFGSLIFYWLTWLGLWFIFFI